MSQCRSLETNPGLMDCVSCLTDEDPLGRDNGPSLRFGRDDGSSLWFGLNDTFRLRMMRSRQPVALFLAVKVAAIIEASKAKIRWAGTMVPAYDWARMMVPAYGLA